MKRNKSTILLVFSPVFSADFLISAVKTDIKMVPGVFQIELEWILIVIVSWLWILADKTAKCKRGGDQRAMTLFMNRVMCTPNPLYNFDLNKIDGLVKSNLDG